MFIPLYDHNPLRHVRRPYANYALIAVTVIAFFLTGGFDEHAVENAAIGFGFIPSVANHYEVLPPEYSVLPEPATYLTYAFLHANLVHLLGNMAFLWVFGDNIEDALGPLRYLIFYGACAVLAAVMHALINPASPTPLIGASGAIAGVVGAYLVLHPRVKLWILALGRIPLRLSAGWVIGAWILFQIFNIVVASPENSVAWWAHLGGMVAGALLVIAMRRRGVALLDRNTPEPG